MMKKLFLMTALACTAISCNAGRNIRTAQDITPGNPVETQLDWRYGANDLRVQTTNINKRLMDRWCEKTQYEPMRQGKPRIIITDIDNRTDTYIPTDMIRDIFEGVAINDERYSILVADTKDERELDRLMAKISNSPKYANSSKPSASSASVPQFLAKVRITKATTMQPKFDIEDYRMTISLYDVETQEIVDSAWDVLRKKVKP